MILNSHFSKLYSEVKEANLIEISRLAPSISYSCKKEQGGNNEYGLFEGEDGEIQELIDLFYDRKDFFNFENCLYLKKKMVIMTKLLIFYGIILIQKEE